MGIKSKEKWWALSLWLFMILFFACQKEPGSNQSEEESIVEKLPDVPTEYSGVFLQGFWWDSFDDPKISNYSSYYAFLNDQLDLLQSASFDLIWLPPTSEGEGMGYHPRRLFDFTSNHGTATELRTLLTNMRSRNIHAMADLVFNHRVGTDTWTDFTEPAWSCTSICIDDEGYTNPDAFGTKPCGPEDDGEAWLGARDLNHNSTEVRNGLVELLQRLREIGFNAWRFDFVKGFHPRHVAYYDDAVERAFSVGEFWDGNVLKLKNWVDAVNQVKTKNTPLTGFDFPLKYKLSAALNSSNYGVLKQNHALAATDGYGSKAITFIDNHDSGCINRNDCDNLFSKDIDKITQAYAYLLTHPGIPMVWIYHYLYSDPSGQLQQDLNELISIRKSQKIHTTSIVREVETVDGEAGYYHAVIEDKLKVVIGNGSPAVDSNSWESLKSGSGYSLWRKIGE